MNSGILTIDDVPSLNTPAIVDYLNCHGITAIMFAEGNRVRQYYDNAIYALQHGMILGNHSYHHPSFSSITPKQCIEEIEACETVLNQLYRDAGVERKYRPFRFPYGDKGGDNHVFLQDYLRAHSFTKVKDTQLGYPWWHENHLDEEIDTLWSYDFAEYRVRPNSGFTMEDVFAKMNDLDPSQGAALFGEGNRHILLLHAHDETEDLAPGYYRNMLDYLLAKGFVFEKPEFISAE